MKHVYVLALTGSLALASACKESQGAQPEPEKTAASKPAEGAEPSKAEPSKAEGAKMEPAKAASKPAAAAASPDALKDPAKAKLTAPEKFTVKLATTEGDILIDVNRAWAPNGADRFYNLVKAGYYDNTAFFRVIGGFMAQIGISGDPKVNEVWREARIQDDPVRQSNERGYVTFAAASAPNTRTTQFFINFGNNNRLDGMRFAPFGKVQKDSMAIVDKLYSGYGEGFPRGRGPDQGRLQREGNSYLKAEFPELDYVKQATVIE